VTGTEDRRPEEPAVDHLPDDRPVDQPPVGHPPEDRPPEDRPPEDLSPGNRTARFAWGAVVVILVAVVVLIVYALTDAPVTQLTVHRVTTSSSVMAEVAKVPLPVFDAIGGTAPGTQLVAPTVLSGQPPLKSAGKPEVLYVGAEYCPFCGAERWPLIVALSRFGRFSRLKNMQSAPLSVFPGIQTFSFVGATYTSPYLSFTGVELFSDALDSQGAYARIATLSPTQAAVVSRYGSPGGTSTGPPGPLPFVDVGNRLVTSTSAFSPALIVKEPQATIASGLTQPTDTITQAIVAAANQLTAGICASTGQMPASVCSTKGVRAAADSLGIG
jgi:hypothetical protein